MPATYALSLYRGDTCRVRFVLWEDEAKTQPVDLTGVTAAAEIRPAPRAQAVVTFACAIDGNAIDCVLSAAQTATAPTAAYWDLQLTYPSGDVQTIVAGGVSTRGDITGSAA